MLPFRLLCVPTSIYVNLIHIEATIKKKISGSAIFHCIQCQYWRFLASRFHTIALNGFAHIWMIGAMIDMRMYIVLEDDIEIIWLFFFSLSHSFTHSFGWNGHICCCVYEQCKPKITLQNVFFTTTKHCVPFMGVACVTIMHVKFAISWPMNDRKINIHSKWWLFNWLIF